MNFPPPKELTFSAYMAGLISKEKYFELIKEFNEEYEKKEAAKNEAYNND